MFIVLVESIGAVVLAVGIALIVSSRGRRRGYPSCGACGYNLTGSIGTGTGCSECGSSFTVAGITPPREKRRLSALALGVLMALLGAGWGVFWAVAIIY